MDNFGNNNLGNQGLDKPIPLDDPGPSGSGVSHSPLNLGGGSAVQKPPAAAPRPVAAPKPVARPAASPVAAARPVQRVPASGGRIQGVKTFFTKLHPGAIAYLDEQITRWLKENPGVSIKQTNVTTGEVQAKKTEPNILITVWY